MTEFRVSYNTESLESWIILLFEILDSHTYMLIRHVEDIKYPKHLI